MLRHVALPPLAEGLLGAAQEAFTLAYNRVAVVLAILFVVLALITFATLRHIRPLGEESQPDGSKPGGGAVGSRGRHGADGSLTG